MIQTLSKDNQTDKRENYYKLLIWWKIQDVIEEEELLRKK